MTDKNGLIQVANQAAEEMLQVKLQSVKGSSLIDLLYLSPAIAENIKQARDQKTPVSADSLDLILADGQQKVVNIHVQPFNDEERNTVGTLLAGVTLLGMGWRVQQEKTRIAGRNWYLVLGICLFYPLLNSWIVL